MGNARRLARQQQHMPSIEDDLNAAIARARAAVEPVSTYDVNVRRRGYRRFIVAVDASTGKVCKEIPIPPGVSDSDALQEFHEQVSARGATMVSANGDDVPVTLDMLEDL